MRFDKTLRMRSKIEGRLSRVRPALQPYSRPSAQLRSDQSHAKGVRATITQPRAFGKQQMNVDHGHAHLLKIVTNQSLYEIEEKAICAPTVQASSFAAIGAMRKEFAQSLRSPGHLLTNNK